jgi:hypothetical protein
VKERERIEREREKNLRTNPNRRPEDIRTGKDERWRPRVRFRSRQSTTERRPGKALPIS